MLELLSAAINSYVAASARGEGGQPLPSTRGQMSISRFLVSFFAIPPPIVPDTLHIRVTAPCKHPLMRKENEKKARRRGRNQISSGGSYPESYPPLAAAARPWSGSWRSTQGWSRRGDSSRGCRSRLPCSI
ncbi:hypothetical protein V8C44DRAFT_132274 [Trichoderma aethiopicum]